MTISTNTNQQNRNQELKIEASKSQKRLAGLVGVAGYQCYADATRSLEAAGYAGSAVPAGHSWRSAAKLNDAELVAACTLEVMTGHEQFKVEY